MTAAWFIGGAVTGVVLVYIAFVFTFMGWMK